MATKTERLPAFLGARLREARLEQGYTQQQIAELIGLSSEVYGRYERGQTLPSVPTLRLLAQTLDVSADVLLGLDHDVRTNPAENGSPELRRLVRAAGSLSQKQLKVVRAMVELVAAPRSKR